MRVRLKNVSKSFKDADRTLAVLSDVTVEFPQQGTVGIVGRSGIGKSTMLHILGGLDSPTAGSVSYDDVEVSRLTVDQRAAIRARKVGFVFQFHHLLPEFSALENAAMPLIIAGDSEENALGQAEKLLQKVGLGHRLSHRPGQLSGGEQQRVSIARALVAEPGLILADEPTGNLDVATAQEVQSILLEAAAKPDRLLIVVTHNQELASSLDHIFEMLPGGKLELVSKKP